MLIPVADNYKNFIKSNGLTFITCLLSVIIMAVYVYWLPPVMILWVLFWIIENKSGFHKESLWKNKAAILFLLFIVFFFWQVSGLLLTESLDTGVERLFKRLPFLLFPMVLFYPSGRILKNIDMILRLFAIFTFLYILYCFGNALHHSLINQDRKWLFRPHPLDYDYENFFYGARFSGPIHPSYLSMYIITAVLILFESFDNADKYFKKGLSAVMIFTLIIAIYLLSARAGILAAIIILPVYFLFKFNKRLPKIVVLLIIVALVAGFVVIARKNDRVNSSIEQISNQKFNEILKDDPRLLIWQSAFGVIKRNIILGVGPGDATVKLKEEFISRGYIDGYYSNLNAHNQFLEIWLENGLIGLIIFLAILVYMLHVAIRQKNILLGLFVVSIIIFFLFETMMNRQAGVSFFSLFSFLLIYARGKSDMLVKDS